VQTVSIIERRNAEIRAYPIESCNFYHKLSNEFRFFVDSFVPDINDT